VKVRTHQYRGVHVAAHCEQCDWDNWRQYTVGQDARRHAKKTGHTVTYERGDSYRVIPEQDDEG
jgi:hypothetical protein